MRKVSEFGKDVKARRAKAEEVLGESFGELSIDTKLELIQQLIPLGLLAVEDVLQQEVEALAGGKYKREGLPGHVRWGSQRGSVYIADQKIPIEHPRVRDMKKGKEVELAGYNQLQEPRNVDEGLLSKILLGLSCRDYRKCSEAIPEAIGLAPSTVSRRFIRASKKKLRQLMERSLEGLDIVAVIIDGKTFRRDEMIVALGITMKGRKVILGFIQSGSENARVIKEFLKDLIERGLETEQGFLFVMDGSKGIRKAVREIFGKHALVQRCQWHKRENVLSYLPKGKRAYFRRLLQQAYQEPTREDARRRLKKIQKELSLINQSAARSLEEGMEETLTLHKLGLFKKLGRSLKTTNCIESVMSLIEQKTQKVDYWRNSNQMQRWLATALLDIEPRLNRISGHKYLPHLREAIQGELGIESTNYKETVAA